MNTFCAINIIDSNNRLRNKDLCPIMYIWDGQENLFESMKKTEDFSNYIKELGFFEKCKDYNFGKIIGFTYKKEDDKEKSYEHQEILIQELFPCDLENPLSQYILNECMEDLYYKAFKKKLENPNVVTIYNKLKEKYKERLSDETIYQAIRSKLQTDEKYIGLNLNNINNLIDILKNELNETL